MSPRAAVVILAAGSGRRLGAATNKVLLPLAGIPLLAHSVRTVATLPALARLVLVIRPEDRADVAAAIGPHLGDLEAWLVEGGVERHDSEQQALAVLRPDIESGLIEVVVIHDAARPLAPPALFEAVTAAAFEHGGAIPVVPATGLLTLEGHRPPGSLVTVQTPQAFAAPALLAAYDDAARAGFSGTDTAATLEEYAEARVVGIPSLATNLKVTLPGDVELAQALLSAAR